MTGIEKLLEVESLSSAEKITKDEVNEKINQIVNSLSPIKSTDLPFVIMALDKFLEAIKLAHPQEFSIARMLSAAFDFETVYVERSADSESL